MRLGIPVSFPEWVDKCDCGRNLDIKGSDTDGFHLLTCKNGGGPVWTHDSMMSVWSECLSSVHLLHKCDPRDRSTHSNNRPDILVYDSETESNVELDVALAHPWASDILPRAATTGGSAAMRRKQIKENKYAQERLPGGYSPTVVPLVFEHFSHWGEKASEYLKVLSALWRDDNGRSNIAEFKTHWRQRFSIKLHQCNSSVISRKMAAISAGQKSCSVLDKYQFVLK